MFTISVKRRKGPVIYVSATLLSMQNVEVLGDFSENIPESLRIKDITFTLLLNMNTILSLWSS